MSFSSKLLHTVDPRYPIWDSVVTKDHFTCKNRERLCVERYGLYQNRFYEYMSSEEGIELIQFLIIRILIAGLAM